MSFWTTETGADEHKPVAPESAPRGKAAERILAAELLQEMRLLRTDVAERLQHGVVNHVLAVETRAFPTEGRIKRSYPTPAGSVEVRNIGAHDVTVCSFEAATAPAEGDGVAVVPAGVVAQVNLASRILCLFGTATERVCIQVFTTPGRGATLSAIDGGGA